MTSSVPSSIAVAVLEDHDLIVEIGKVGAAKLRYAANHRQRNQIEDGRPARPPAYVIRWPYYVLCRIQRDHDSWHPHCARNSPLPSTLKEDTMRSLPTIAAVAFLALVATACDRSPVDIEDDDVSVGPEPADPEPTLPPPPQTRAITVMTRNLYLGADLTPVMGAASPEQIPGAVGDAWNRIVLNDFPARADAIAGEIQSTRPDVIGLQEVAKFRIQSPGDFLVGNPQAATAVAYDYLTLLLDALQARGLSYRIASVVQNADIELPAVTSTGLIDVRWTDHDVILVRDGIEITGETSNNFALNVAIPVGGGSPITIRRGWNRVDLMIDDQPFRPGPADGSYPRPLGQVAFLRSARGSLI